MFKFKYQVGLKNIFIIQGVELFILNVIDIVIFHFMSKRFSKLASIANSVSACRFISLGLLYGNCAFDPRLFMSFHVSKTVSFKFVFGLERLKDLINT